MPELPEVETIVRDLRAGGVTGRTVTNVRVHWARSVEGLTPHTFRKRLAGQRIAAIGRYGKYIVLTLSRDTLLIHLRMSGRLVLGPAAAAGDPHERVVLRLDDGRALRYHDTRKFGRCTLHRDPARKLGLLGPDALDPRLTAAVFERLLAARRGMLKPLLLNQRFLAGLGNIYVDEALFEAGLHPQRQCATLTAAERKRLYRAVRRVLRRGIRRGGTSLGGGEANFYSVAGRRGRNQDRLNVFRRQGEPCPRCGTAIERIMVGQRGTHLCPRCQPARPSAPGCDRATPRPVRNPRGARRRPTAAPVDPVR